MKKAMIPVVGVAAFALGGFLESEFGVFSKASRWVRGFFKKDEAGENEPAAKSDPEKPAEPQEGTK